MWQPLGLSERLNDTGWGGRLCTRVFDRERLGSASGSHRGNRDRERDHGDCSFWPAHHTGGTALGGFPFPGVRWLRENRGGGVLAHHIGGDRYLGDVVTRGNVEHDRPQHLFEDGP